MASSNMRFAKVRELTPGDLALVDVDGSLMLSLVLEPASDKATELVLIECVGGKPFEEALPAFELIEARFQTLACQLSGETRVKVKREDGVFNTLGKLPDGAHLHLMEPGPCLRAINHSYNRQVIFVDLLSGERVRPRLNKCFTVSSWELQKEFNSKITWSREFEVRPVLSTGIVREQASQ